MKSTVSRLLVLFLLITFKLSAQFSTLETNDQRLIYYGEASSYLMKYLASCVENSLHYHCKLYDYKPSEKVTVLMHDLNDYGNAGASTIPRNIVSIAIAPANFVYETAPANERINSTMNHEFVHIATLDEASGNDKFFRSLFFGKVAEISENPLTIFYGYLTNPRRASPRWYREGIAVFLETWMAGGLGRALGGYDEMVFRTMVHDSSYFYDIVGLESEGTQTDFQVEVNAYLYGTRFMSYLAYKYGPESLIKWTGRNDGSSGYFASQFEKIYGNSLNNVWSEWITWEKEFQKENLNLIRKNPVTTFRQISNSTLGSLSRAFYDDKKNKIYSGINYPGQIASISSIDYSTGEVDKIIDINGPALYFVSSLAYDSKSGNIFYTSNNNDWRDLLSVNVNSGKSKTLIEKGRIGDLAFNQADSSLWGVRHFNGISTLVRIPYPYNDWNQIYSWPFGKDMYDIDISHDGKNLIGALAEINGTQLLIKMNVDSLLNSEISYDTIFNFENSLPANFIFSNDDKSLYGSSYYSGVSNIYKYDFETNEMNIITNCETGFFRPIEISEDSLIVFNFSSNGFSPVVISKNPVENVAAINFLGNEVIEKYPVLKKWIAPPPSSINIDSITEYAGTYNSFANIGISSIYPIIEGYKNFVSYGLRFNISDPVAFQDFNLTVSYSPNRVLSKDEKFHGGFEYNHFGFTARAIYNNADFYDLFGPTKVSRKGYSFGIKYHDYFIYNSPEIFDYNLFANYYGNLEKLPSYQNVDASFDKLFNFGFGTTYKDFRSSLGAVDYEKGFKWQGSLNTNYVREIFYPHIRSDFDFGFSLPINHSSIWFRSSIGYSN
ncbi:MAG: hypothetical protein ABI550_09150, partial [Ignavibacteriaceae bacterium]